MRHRGVRVSLATSNGHCVWARSDGVTLRPATRSRQQPGGRSLRPTGLARLGRDFIQENYPRRETTVEFWQQARRAYFRQQAIRPSVHFTDAGRRVPAATRGTRAATAAAPGWASPAPLLRCSARAAAGMLHVRPHTRRPGPAGGSTRR